MRLRQAVFPVWALVLVCLVAVVVTACSGLEETAGISSTTEASAPGTSQTSAGSATPTTARMPAGESGVLEVAGLVDNPGSLSAADIEEMQMTTVTVEDSSGTSEEYHGVRLSELFKAVGVRSDAVRVAMTAHADGFVVELPLQDIYWSSDSVLAVNEDGTLDVVIPGLDKNAWVKDVVKMEFK